MSEELDLTPEQLDALKELDKLFTKWAMDDSLWDENNKMIQKPEDTKE